MWNGSRVGRRNITKLPQIKSVHVRLKPGYGGIGRTPTSTQVILQIQHYGHAMGENKT